MTLQQKRLQNARERGLATYLKYSSEFYKRNAILSACQRSINRLLHRKNINQEKLGAYVSECQVQR